MSKFNLFLKENKKTIFKTIFLILVVGLIIFTGLKELKSIDFLETKSILEGLPKRSIFLFLLLSILAIASISLYDFFISDYLGLNINKFTLFNVSFLASTINNISGLGGLTGATIRTVLFKNSKNKEDDLINYNLLLLPATGIGLSLMTLVCLLNFNYVLSIVRQSFYVGLAIIIFIAFIPLYFSMEKLFNFFSKKYSLDLGQERLKIRSKLMLASSLEWFLAFVLFYAISLKFSWEAGFFKLFTAFTLASIGGILSMLPGGLGSFDLIILLQLQNLGLESENILAILIVYRVFYYFIPLILSIFFTLLGQARSKEKVISFPKLRNFISKTSSITNFLLSILISVSGILLLLDGLFPTLIDDIKINTGISQAFLRLSYNFQIALGILLLAISKQIRHKVKRSYNISLALLIFALGIVVLKDFSYIEVLYLLLVLLLIYLSKDSFYRQSIAREPAKTFFNSILYILGIALYTRTAKTIFDNIFHKANLVHIEHRDPLGFVISYGLPIVVYLVYEGTKKTIYQDPRYETFNEDKLKDFLSLYPGNLMTHLAFLEDKNIFYSDKGNIMIQYALKNNLAIVLGDPIGDMDYLQEGLNDFRVFIDSYGYKSVFYESSHEFLSFYHDNGYHFFKLGETGILDLENFSLEGSKARDFRNILKRFEKDGYDFSIIKGEDLDQELFEELELLSQEWLDSRPEMGFSLGFFDRDYIMKTDIGLLRHVESQKLLAFTSMMPAYDQRSISIDLMRIKKEPPNNTMVYLILSLILHYKEEGLKNFNLGMAPLSNVGTSKKAHKGEKLAHMLFEYGNFFYSFHGLRNFKNKFKPDWRPRYLVYQEVHQLPHILISVTSVIHSQK